MLKRKKLIVGNWKMNVVAISDAKKLISDVKKKITKVKRTEVVFCPTFVHLSSLSLAISKKTQLGAQNVSHEDTGPYTGEVSAIQLKNLGVSSVIIGHSERRKIGESDEVIHKKILTVLRVGLTPIVCIGEDIHDEEGAYLEIIKLQILSALSGVTKSQISDVVIAYEPVWAVGGQNAMSTRDVHKMCLYIKRCLREMFGTYGDAVLILYGGAVNYHNAQEIVEESFIDGLLVGRDSLDAVNFSEIIKSVDQIK